MQLGVIFPQTAMGADPSDIRRYATTVEQAGFSHISVFDHVLLPHPDRLAGGIAPYTYTDTFHEVFVLLGYLAAVTERVGLATEVLILPQRQTALVAKQAAEVAVLSGDRLRLGVGTGWNRLEYEALGMSWSGRGRRQEEQIDLMRRLWAQDLVTFDGTTDTVTESGINPLPPSRDIPVWFGGGSEAALRRMARVGDGWMAMNLRPDTAETLERVRGWISDAGRDPDAFGVEARVAPQPGQPLAEVLDQLHTWRSLGATHASIDTMQAGLPDIPAHLALLAETLAAWRNA